MPYRDPSDPKCPACREPIAADGQRRCSQCGYGLRPQEYRKRPPPKQLFGPSPQETDDRGKLEARFRCPYCASFGAKVSQLWLARSNSGASTYAPLLTARCLHCAAVQMFSPEHFDPETPLPWDE